MPPTTSRSCPAAQNSDKQNKHSHRPWYKSMAGESVLLYGPGCLDRADRLPRPGGRAIFRSESLIVPAGSAFGLGFCSVPASLSRFFRSEGLFMLARSARSPRLSAGQSFISRSQSPAFSAGSAFCLAFCSDSASLSRFFRSDGLFMLARSVLDPLLPVRLSFIGRSQRLFLLAGSAFDLGFQSNPASLSRFFRTKGLFMLTRSAFPLCI